MQANMPKVTRAPGRLAPLLLVLLLVPAGAGRAQEAAPGDTVGQRCADCRLAGESVEALVRKPRQMDAYGQMGARIDLDKIKKAVCKDLLDDRDRQRCRAFYLNHQASLFDWKRQQEQTNSRISFADFVCIKQLKYCCPSGSFGPKCTKCTSCGHNERCLGEGTRSGNGTCVCKAGHAGTNCATCLPGYYQDKTAHKLATGHSAKRTLCRPCHRSCLYCRQDGPHACEVCRPGFTWMAGLGCSDIDECLQGNGKICGDNTFCVNTEGSYFCYECDRACNGCHGDGPDMCLECATGYKLDQGNCVATRKTILPPEANYYRYAIYVGLCVCTCIILHNSVYLASLIGLAVALYIGFSEYIMSGHPVASGAGQSHVSSASGMLPHSGL